MSRHSSSPTRALPARWLLAFFLVGLISTAALALQDRDGDGVADEIDNCPGDYNPAQQDEDRDSVGNICDNCWLQANPDQRDTDLDGLGDVCDSDDDDDGVVDDDGDGSSDPCPSGQTIDCDDNCPLHRNGP
ncbi:MAG: thrombospondin type 3 repeat-containing protein, partial [Acidobacteriota bacterium]